MPQDETGTPAPAPTQTASTGDDTTGAGTQTALWLLAGAAALVAGASSTRTRVGGYRALAAANGYPSVGAALRSWLPRGGSERAAIGGSQYVLINDPTSPREYVFHENVPPGGHIAVNPDGSATIYDRDGRAVSTIAKPWAYDALGRPQRTWYTVDNNGDLVQHVDPAPDAVYPILADPPDPRIKQQQAAAAQGTSAHRTGTGTPLNKSPKADPPPPPANPPANAPDYGGAPHNQAPTHSGLPPSQTAPELQTSSPDGNGSSANPGLQNALTGPIDNTPQPEATSPTQGAQPAPGQNLSYSDFLNNQLGGQTVGTVQQRPGPDGTTQYFRTDPGGAEYTAVAAGPSGGGGMTFVFNDGSIFDSEVVDGVSSLTRVDSEGTRTTEFSNGERVVIRRDGSGEWTPPPADANGSVLSAMLEGTGRLIDKAAAGVQPARHALNAAEAAEVAEWLGRFSRTLGPVGIGVSIADGGVHIADGAPVPETIGSTSGGIAGAALGATTGASIGSFIPGPGTFVGAVIGAGVGAFVGSTYGARVGHGARVVWRKLFG